MPVAFDSSVTPYDAFAPYDGAADAWALHARITGRTPVWVVEVDLDWIADGAVTATNPDNSLCYRTPATTDQGAFTVGTKTRRFMTMSQRPIPELSAIPCVAAVGLGAEELRVGEAMSYFGQATVDLVDFVDDDRRAEDPFATDTSRSGLDLKAGSYFSKLLARNPYWTGRKIRIVEGFATDGVWYPADSITHTYYVRDIQGPSDGKVRITAAGPLQLLNLESAEAPAPSEGTLAADITAAATTATLSDAVIAGDYPASGTLRIGDEVMTYTRSGVTLTITRAQLGTVAATHQAGDAVQWCLVYSSQQIDAIIADLLTTYGGVDAGDLDTAGWATEFTEYLSTYILSAAITQPTKIIDLVRELCNAAGILVWWDDVAGKVRMRAIRTAMQSDTIWNDRLHLMTRPVVRRDPTARVSRTDICMDLRSAALDPTDASSYRFRLVGIPQGDGATEHGSERLMLLASRWLAVSQVLLAERAAYLMTLQLRDGRQTIVVEVAAKDAAANLGDAIILESADLVDRTGQPRQVKCVAVKREALMAGSRYRFTLQPLPYAQRVCFLTDVSLADYDAGTSAEHAKWGYLAAATRPYFTDNTDAYIIVE
jgi:hypothetical protein